MTALEYLNKRAFFRRITLKILKTSHFLLCKASEQSIKLWKRSKCSTTNFYNCIVGFFSIEKNNMDIGNFCNFYGIFGKVFRFSSDCTIFFSFFVGRISQSSMQCLINKKKYISGEISQIDR